ncbi:hypothetical protein AAFF_G00348540 [Aldrovandia affinis]|uniref:Uncharacterized protein n=1 Tax=Aldrovandia affinis TaxID=143900 RepID=A0AAD7W023_9TELE|nr:hypothetical protein AAFF_G00348540 [Aldrovandia affinis]
MYDLNVIYSRVIALFSSDRDVDVKDVLAYELAPVPTAMFTEDGMRICKAKSTLKKSLQIEVSRRNAGDADITVIDGSALLWTIHWPADGTVADFIENVKTRLTSYLSESDVYLIFDRYYDYSIKSVTRDVRETGVNKKHHLLLSTKLPAQKVVLSSIENKKQLNLLLCEELTQDRLFHLRSTNKHKLVVTGEDPCPIEIKMEERRTRYDLENQQEEADTIIVQQVLGCAGEAHQISVVSDDTDVFILLLHHYHQAGLDVPLIMESPCKGRAIVDIKSTLAKHSQIVKNLLPAHAISGCDTVVSYYGLGKGSVIKVLKAGNDLSAIGNVDAPFQQVLDQATAFISACYGIKESTDMPEGAHVIARSGTASASTVCEEEARTGVLELPSPCQLVEDPRFQAGYVGDSPDGGDGANGTRSSDPRRCTSCGLRRLLLRNDPLRRAKHRDQ